MQSTSKLHIFWKVWKFKYFIRIFKTSKHFGCKFKRNFYLHYVQSKAYTVLMTITIITAATADRGVFSQNIHR